MRQPLAIDLYCGLGGWTEGLLAEGYRVVGFDIERHVYGEHQYPAQLVIQDVTTLHGSQFKDAALIVASPPCQGYSYRAMPWKRAKALPPPDNTLFEACFRIQREASDAAGHHIPLVVENVRGAQKWVGKARYHFGSFYLWGDVPALMPLAIKRAMKMPLGSGVRTDKGRSAALANYDQLRADIKNQGGSWFNIGSLGQKETNRNPVHEAARLGRHTDVGNGARFTSRDCGIERPSVNQLIEDAPEGTKIAISGHAWYRHGLEQLGGKSNARKAASAQIAKIPFVLSQHIAKVFRADGTDPAL